MKNYLLTIFAITIALPTVAQVSVKGTSFIYSKGTDIFVKEAINLDSGTNIIYLRKEAQLMQGDDSSNIGTGELSVFQEGAANNYTYNYWSSPVSQTTGSGNQDFLNTQIKYPTLQAGFKENEFTDATDYTDLSTDLTTSSADALILATNLRDGTTDQQTVTGMTITQTQPLRIASRWLYKYNNAGTGGGNGYASWQAFQSNTAVVEPGYGFTMKGVALTTGPNLVPHSIGGSTTIGQRYDFRGRPNNGTITLSVVADDFALVGNPYPSALDLKKFLIDNTTVDGSGALTAASQIDAQILFWESKATSHQLTDYIGGYGSYVPGNRNILAEDGMYTPAAFKRYDSNGNISGGSTAGGSTGFAPDINSFSSRRYAAIGQGFMIARTSTANGGLFTPSSMGAPVFNNSQRVFRREDGLSSIFKSVPGSGAGNPTQTNPGFVRPKIYFSAAVNDLYVREFILAFGDDSTDGLDWGLEAVVDNNIQVNDMYMAQEGKKLVIKTIPFLETKKVPVSFVLRDPSTFEISIKSIQHFNTPFILLHDKQNGTVYDLKTSVATVVLPAGTYNDRFEIVFEQPSTLSTGSEVLATTIDIFQNNDRQLLTVLNPQLKDIKNIALYDLAGRLIVSEKTITATDHYSFNTASYSTGIYVVRVTDNANNETAVKVSIAN